MRWIVTKFQEAAYAEAYALYADEEGLILKILDGDPETALLAGVRVPRGHDLEALWAPYIVSRGTCP